MQNSVSPPLDRKTRYSYLPGTQYETPEVSIITPFYNTGDIFRDTAFCILNQSFQNFEWIIVDDQSTDPVSLNGLKEISASDARIRIMRNELNSGPGGSRNNGVKVARGKFLFFVDSDDLVEYTIIEKYWLFLNLNREFSFCNAWHFGFGSENYEWKKGFETGKNMLHENVIQPTFMARRTLFNFVEFDETIRDGFEDWDFWLRCADAGFWGYTLSEFLYWYRRVDNASEKWQNWDKGEKMKAFQKNLYTKYANNFIYRFPSPMRSKYVRGTIVGNNIFHESSLNLLSPSAKKKVFFIIPWMAIGGADKFNLDVVGGLTMRNWEVTIITTQFSDNPWYSEFLAFTSDIFILSNYADETDYFSCVEYLVTSRNPDCILFSNSETGYYLAPLIKYVFPEIPLIDYNHMEEDYWNMGGHPQQAVIYKSIFNHHVVSSNHLKKWMIERETAEANVSVVYTGIDYDKVSPSLEIRAAVRTQWKIDDDLCIIVFSGRIASQKQPHVLVNTIKELTRDIPDGFVLAIIGDGPDKAAIENWTIANELTGKVWFFGALNNEEAISVMKACDIFFLPSLWEGISLAIYEAMALGLPIVGADVGGQKELVSPKEGFLIKKSTPERETNDYAKVLRTLIQDKSRRTQMGLAARQKVVKGFGIQNMWDSMEKILEHVSLEKKMSYKRDILESFRQVYALLFFEKRLADNLWHTNQSHQVFLQTNKNDVVKGKELRNAPSDVLWYHTNYEVLPAWYKKAGHVLKIMNGSKNWRTIYSSKYKTNPAEISGIEWYVREYDSLPSWYKKFGVWIKAKQKK